MSIEEIKEKYKDHTLDDFYDSLLYLQQKIDQLEREVERANFMLKSETKEAKELIK